MSFTLSIINYSVSIRIDLNSHDVTLWNSPPFWGAMRMLTEWLLLKRSELSMSEGHPQNVETLHRRLFPVAFWLYTMYAFYFNLSVLFQLEMPLLYNGILLWASHTVGCEYDFNKFQTTGHKIQSVKYKL